MIKYNSKVSVKEVNKGEVTEEFSNDISLLKITFTFSGKFYEKYDIFKLGNSMYICINRPRKNEDNTWSIDAIPFDLRFSSESGYDTEFLGNTVAELYS